MLTPGELTTGVLLSLLGALLLFAWADTAFDLVQVGSPTATGFSTAAEARGRLDLDGEQMVGPFPLPTPVMLHVTTTRGGHTHYVDFYPDAPPEHCCEDSPLRDPEVLAEEMRRWR